MGKHPVCSLLAKRSQFRNHSYLSIGAVGGASRSSVLSHILYCQGFIRPVNTSLDALLDSPGVEETSNLEDRYAVAAIGLEKEREKNRSLSTNVAQFRKRIRDL